MEVTNINQLDIANGFYTYADYLLWKFEERLELIKGKIFRMSPAPAIAHQRVSRKLSGELYNFFKGKTCELFTAPFDVVLPNAHGKEDSVVQPDLCVVCAPEKLADGKCCVGAPDLVIEILSPHNSMRDLDMKFHLYEEAGEQRNKRVCFARRQILWFTSYCRGQKHHLSKIPYIKT